MRGRYLALGLPWSSRDKTVCPLEPPLVKGQRVQEAPASSLSAAWGHSRPGTSSHSVSRSHLCPSSRKHTRAPHACERPGPGPQVQALCGLDPRGHPDQTSAPPPPSGSRCGRGRKRRPVASVLPPGWGGCDCSIHADAIGSFISVAASSSHQMAARCQPQGQVSTCASTGDRARTCRHSPLSPAARRPQPRGRLPGPGRDQGSGKPGPRPPEVDCGGRLGLARPL